MQGLPVWKPKKPKYEGEDKENLFNMYEEA